MISHWIFALSLSTLILLYIIFKRITINHVDQIYHEAMKRSSGATEKAPDTHGALHMFLQSYKKGNENALLQILKIYFYGAHPNFNSDKILAIRISKRILLDDHFSKNLKKICEIFLTDTSMVTYDADLDAQYDDLPRNILQILDEIIEYHSENNIDIIPCEPYFAYEIDDEVANPPVEYEENTIIIEEEQRPDQNRILVHNDSQNVHNPSVSNSSLHVFNSLDIPTKSFDQNVMKLYENTNDLNLSKEELEDMDRTVRSLGNSVHSKFNASEQEIFNRVFERASKNEDTLKIFCTNLSSSVEYGKVVCSTGKIVRMLSTFDGIDNDIPSIKPDWAIREEIARKASKIRDEVLCTLTDSERKNYESSDEKANHIVQNMISRLEEECTREYVNEKLLSPPALELILEEFNQAF